jgi:hypothetical protein
MNMTEQAEEEPLVVLDRAGLYCPAPGKGGVQLIVGRRERKWIDGEISRFLTHVQLWVSSQAREGTLFADGPKAASQQSLRPTD